MNFLTMTPQASAHFRKMEPATLRDAIPVVSLLTGDLEVIALQVRKAKSDKARRNQIARFAEVNARRCRIAEQFNIQDLAREVTI